MSIPCILTVVLDGKTAVQQTAHGVLLWDALRQSGYALSAPCGGHGKCGKCRVRAEGALSPRPDADGFCLACQTHLAGDATVWLDRPSVLSNIEGAGKMPEFSLNPPPGKYGLALDIGTTTLAAQLLSLKDGRILAAVTAENPQRQIAHDVIGRIQAAMDGQGLALQAQIRGEIDRMRRALCVQAGLPETAIDFSVYTGNTTMLYLLTGRNPKPLSAAPFEADCLFDYESDAIYFPPCVGSYVGADISCALLASDMVNRHRTAMLIDIGTNGEIVLLHEGRLFCCATAAGPAFEGMGIGCGVGSIPGAVSAVQALDGKLVWETLENAPPAGICGSGLIDATAALLELGWLDETGYLEQESVEIAPGAALTRKDIRAIQLAKGAIRAGMETLMQRAGIAASDLEALYIAGGFGRHIRVESAVSIGLIPNLPAERICAIGNAALAGASMLLLSLDLRGRVRGLVDHCICVNLGGDPAFQTHYMDALCFGD